MGGDYFYKNSNKKTKPRQHYTNEVVIKDKTFFSYALGPAITVGHGRTESSTG